MVCPVSALNPASSLPPQGASPRAIRDALTITEDRAEFDREYQRALDRAAHQVAVAVSTQTTRRAAVPTLRPLIAPSADM